MLYAYLVARSFNLQQNNLNTKGNPLPTLEEQLFLCRVTII